MPTRVLYRFSAQIDGIRVRSCIGIYCTSENPFTRVEHAQTCAVGNESTVPHQSGSHGRAVSAKPTQTHTGDLCLPCVPHKEEKGAICCMQRTTSSIWIGPPVGCRILHVHRSLSTTANQRFRHLRGCACHLGGVSL
ncbi:unnamed protein product [Ectocarpus fasciculatus]